MLDEGTLLINVKWSYGKIHNYHWMEFPCRKNFMFKFTSCRECWTRAVATTRPVGDVKIFSSWSQRLRQFSGTPDPFPPVPTSSDYGEHHQVQTGSRKIIQTGSTNNLATETDIDAISVAIPNVSFLQKTASGQVQTFCLGTVSTSEFRFIPDAVLRSRTMSVPVEVDRACLETVS